MSKLLVQSFGPIRNGGLVWVETGRVTVLSGKQGSGKSTIAKLISLFTWLEKALVRGDFTAKQLMRKGAFVKSYCKFHNIHNYFMNGTRMEFEGDKFRFMYSDGELKVEEIVCADYMRPQVMYIPAERNFMTSIESAEKVRNLPSSLRELQVEYFKALKSIKGAEELPLEGYMVTHDNLNNVTWLRNADSRIRMTEAASGFQSLVPLVLVTHYLQQRLGMEQVSGESSEERERYDAMLKKILADSQTDEATKGMLVRQLTANQRNHRLVNIVEEMEQNLFPESQRAVLYDLLGVNNAVEGNQLVLTTHSPYVISYLSLAVKAKEVYSRADSDDMKSRVVELVPEKAMLSPGDVAFYEIADDGEISQLRTYKGMPDDGNVLNMALGDLGDIYEQLVDIEELCRR